MKTVERVIVQFAKIFLLLRKVKSENSKWLLPTWSYFCCCRTGWLNPNICANIQVQISSFHVRCYIYDFEDGLDRNWIVSTNEEATHLCCKRERSRYSSFVVTKYKNEYKYKQTWYLSKLLPNQNIWAKVLHKSA